VRVVGVARAELLLHLAVVARALVLVRDLEADRRAERLAVEDARQDADRVRLLPLRRELALAGRAAVEVDLDLGRRDRKQRGAAVDHRAERAAVRLAPRRHAEEMAERVAHVATLAGDRRRCTPAQGQARPDSTMATSDCAPVIRSPSAVRI